MMKHINYKIGHFNVMLELRNTVLYKVLPHLSSQDIQESIGVLPVITVYVLASNQPYYSSWYMDKMVFFSVSLMDASHSTTRQDSVGALLASKVIAA